jgi:hypothetical protein
MIATTAGLELSTGAAVLAVTAGGEANLRLTVHNRGQHVDRVWIDADGAPAGWSVVRPDSLCVPPRSAGIAWLVVRPPADVPARSVHDLTVRATSAIDGTLELERTVTVHVVPADDAA